MLSKVAVLFFSAVSLGFLVRMVQFGSHWLRGATSPDFNYKALTIWSAIYVVASALVAWVIWKLSQPEDDASSQGSS